MKVGEPFSPYRVFTGIFIPDALVAYTGISAAEKICLARLYKYAGRTQKCWPGQDELAAELGADIRSVQRYIQHLQEAGFIKVQQRGMGTTNEYVMIGHRVFEEDDEAPELESGGTLADPTVLSCQDPTVLSCPKATELSGPSYSTEENQYEENQYTSVDLLRIHTRTKGSKKAGAKDRKILAEWMAGSPEPSSDIAGAFGIYCGDPYWLGRGLPVPAFMGQFQKYLRLWRDQDSGAMREPQRAPVPESGTGSAKLDTGAVQSVSRDFMAEWNVTHGVIPAEYNRSKHVLLEIAANNPEFVRAFPQICEVGRKMVSARGEDSASYADLYWMCSTKAGETRPNWWRLLFGNLRHMGAAEEKSKSRQAATGADALHAMAAKWEGAKN